MTAIQQTNYVEVKSRKGYLVIILALALLVTYGCIEGIYDRLSESGIASALSIVKILVNSSLSFVTGTIAFYSLLRLFDTGPGLIISESGIDDNSGLVPVGKVSWEEVEAISHGKAFFSECVSIRVKQPLKFIEAEKNLFKRLFLERFNRKLGTPVNIAGSGLQIKYADLFNIMQQHFLSAKVETRTIQLKQEKEVIQQEKNALIDSINYAKRIQTALLPSALLISERLGENFILFLPKDIVSGDFYWVEKVNDTVFFAVCDCTGHGVPGALISIVCNNALNRAVKELGLKQPAEILDKVADFVTESLGTDGEVKDGMDASLCAFNVNTRQLVWAGANLPLWIARQNTFYELIEFKPDKQPLGVYQNRKAYTQHVIETKKGDTLYMFSDGYADQFGGERNKKLTRKKLKEIILQQKGLPMHEQHANLQNFHSAYKGNTDQIDDILVMGVGIER